VNFTVILIVISVSLRVLAHEGYRQREFRYNGSIPSLLNSP
jgi:hypothetical protein